MNQLTIGAKTRITDRGLKHLWRLNRLHQFELFAPGITGSGFSTLAELPELSSLKLSSPALTDAAFGYLAEAPALNHLELGMQLSENSGQLTDAGFQQLSDKRNSRNLSINRRGTLISPAGIEKFRKALPNARVSVRE